MSPSGDAVSPWSAPANSADAGGVAARCGEGLGIFVAYNSVGGESLAGRAFLNTFLDHYWNLLGWRF